MQPLTIREESGRLVAYSATGNYLASAPIYSRRQKDLKAIRREVEQMASTVRPTHAQLCDQQERNLSRLQA